MTGWICSLIAYLLFVVISLSEAFSPPDSAQMKCYQTVSPWAEIRCPAAGQDNSRVYHISFTDNGDGTVTDNIAGLMWQQSDHDSTYNWYQATGTYHDEHNDDSTNICGSLSLAGFSDWRLPTLKELNRVFAIYIPYGSQSINARYFPNTHAFGYWTVFDKVDDDMRDSRFMYFYLDHIYHCAKYFNYYVRCVRSLK